jgi:hypothetical protein
VSTRSREPLPNDLPAAIAAAIAAAIDAGATTEQIDHELQWMARDTADDLHETLVLGRLAQLMRHMRAVEPPPLRPWADSYH